MDRLVDRLQSSVPARWERFLPARVRPRPWWRRPISLVTGLVSLALLIGAARVGYESYRDREPEESEPVTESPEDNASPDDEA